MSNKSVISIQPSEKELWDKANAQGYVWIKSDTGFITKDELDTYSRLETVWYKVWLHQEDYGSKWALTKEKLENGDKLN